MTLYKALVKFIVSARVLIGGRIKVNDWARFRVTLSMQMMIDD